MKKWKYLFLDCETNGLPADMDAPATDEYNWPRLIQLAWSLCDANGKQLLGYNELVRPVGFYIYPNPAHRITHDEAREKGQSIIRVLEALNMALTKATAVVAHNCDFDLPILLAEYHRAGMPSMLDHVCAYCTQKQSTYILKLPIIYANRGYGAYKWPSLAELHGFCGYGVIEYAHDAAEDVDALRRCFSWVKRNHPDTFRLPYLGGGQIFERYGYSDEEE